MFSAQNSAQHRVERVKQKKDSSNLKMPRPKHLRPYLAKNLEMASGQRLSAVLRASHSLRAQEGHMSNQAKSMMDQLDHIVTKNRIAYDDYVKTLYGLLESLNQLCVIKDPSRERVSQAIHDKLHWMMKGENTGIRLSGTPYHPGPRLVKISLLQQQKKFYESYNYLKKLIPMQLSPEDREKVNSLRKRYEQHLTSKGRGIPSSHDVWKRFILPRKMESARKARTVSQVGLFASSGRNEQVKTASVPKTHKVSVELKNNKGK